MNRKTEEQNEKLRGGMVATRKKLDCFANLLPRNNWNNTLHDEQPYRDHGDDDYSQTELKWQFMVGQHGIIINFRIYYNTNNLIEFFEKISNQPNRYLFISNFSKLMKFFDIFKFSCQKLHSFKVYDSIVLTWCFVKLSASRNANVIYQSQL